MPGEPSQMSADQPMWPCVQRGSSSRLIFQMICAGVGVDHVDPGVDAGFHDEEHLQAGTVGQVVVDRDDVRMLAVDRPAHRAVGVQAGGAVEDLLAAVAVHVGHLDLVPAAAVGLGEAVEPPELAQFAS